MAAAVLLADNEGIDAVSIRKLAGRLGTRPMSLYRHIDSRDELLEFMYDAVIGGDRDIRHAGDWRADLRVLANSIRQLANDHPWVTSMMSSGRPALGPNALAALEWTLRAVNDLGLSSSEMSRVVFAFVGVVNSAVRSEIAAKGRRHRRDTAEQEWEQAMAPYLDKVISCGKYPLVTELLSGGAVVHGDFDTTITVVLDGLEKYIKEHVTG